MHYIAYKFIFESSCPLKTLLVYFTFLVIFVLVFIVYEVVTESSILLNIKTNQDFWRHILDVTIYSTILLILIWIVKITISYKNEQETELKLLEIMHKLYQNQDIIELYNLLQSISTVYEKDHFHNYINKYIIDDDEIKFLIRNIR